MADDDGQLLLLLATRDVQTLSQLAAASAGDPTTVLREVDRLIERGFVIVRDAAGAVATYQLNPKGVRTERIAPQQRILLIETDVAIQEMMTYILEEEGYAVVISRTPTAAHTLLQAVSFDLVITGGFSRGSPAVMATAADVLTDAGTTPVALFTAHKVDLDDARAAGFRALIEKPFDLATLERQLRALLP